MSYLEPAVSSLQQVAQLQILEVRLKPQVVLGRISHHGPADALRQTKTRVAAPAAGVVVRRTGRAGQSLADGAGWRQLTGAVFVLAAAGVELLREFPKLVVLRAVEERLEVAQPVGLGPAAGIQNRGGDIIYSTGGTLAQRRKKNCIALVVLLLGQLHAVAANLKLFTIISISY